MDDDLRKISVGLRIAKNTRKIVMQNIVFALGIKILVLLLSALGMATMWIASLCRCRRSRAGNSQRHAEEINRKFLPRKKCFFSFLISEGKLEETQ